MQGKTGKKYGENFFGTHIKGDAGASGCLEQGSGRGVRVGVGCARAASLNVGLMQPLFLCRVLTLQELRHG